MDLTQLLHAIGNLPRLAILSLPKSAMRKKCPLKPASSGSTSWPAKLSYLQINDWLPQDPNHWAELLDSLPICLTAMSFENCLNWNPFFQLHQIGAVASNITSLQIGMRREEDGFPIEILLVAFPNLDVLTLPTPVGVPDFATTVSGFPGKGETLSRLAFRIVPDTVQPKPKIGIDFLVKCVEVHPKLTAIEFPEAYIKFDDDTYDKLEEMEAVMVRRAGCDNDNIGVILVYE